MKDNSKADVSHTDEFDKMFQEMVKQVEDDYKVKSEHPETEEEVGLIDVFSSRWINEFNLPNGYQFKDENGNVINSTKIVLEKKEKEYPKTYEECCEILGIIDNRSPWRGYRSVQLRIFQRLLICRDAYWKIAGEEMGLGKPWEPDWKDCTKPKYTIHLHCDGHIFWQDVSHTEYRWLSFPTPEMRDAFKENFKELIEECKELL